MDCISFENPRARSLLFLFVSLFFTYPVYAQVDTDFSGGGALRVGDSTSICDASTAGAIRYDADGTNLVGFCNGSTWLDFVTSSVSGVVNNGNSFAAPMIIGTNDANVLQFETGGSTRVTIDTAGNVGIGTASPTEKVEILRNLVGISDSLKLTNTSSGDDRGSGILFQSGAIDSARLASTRGPNDASGDLHFFTRQSSTLVESLSIVGASGFVGIGTTAPAVELDVNTGAINAASICDENNTNCIDLSAGVAGDNLGNHSATTFIHMNGNNIRHLGLGDAANPGLTFSSDLNTGFWSPLGDTIAASTAGVERLRIDSSGNIGIGSANPTSDLDVTGRIKSNNIDVVTATSPPGFDFTYNNFFHAFDTAGTAPDETRVFEFTSDVSNIGIDFQDYLITAQFSNRLSAGIVAGQIAVNAQTYSSTGMSTYEATGVASLVTGTGSVNKAYGLKSDVYNTNTTDSYGLFLGNILGGNQWGVYQTGADDTNYFAGNVGIGTTSPSVALDVNTGTINAAAICDENNANCLDLSAGVGGGSGDISNGGNTTGADITIGTNDAYDLDLEANGSTVAKISSDGEFIMGTLGSMFSGKKNFRIETNPWDASGDFTHINNEIYKNGNAHFGKIIGIRNQIRGDSSNSQDQQVATYNIISSWASSLNSGMGTLNELESKSGSTTDMTGSLSNLKVDGGTVQNYYGFRAMASNSATLTNAYGLYIDDLPGTTTYGIYQAGSTDDNYFSGNVGIGTTGPAAKLHVDGSGAGGGLCVTSDGTCGAIPAGGEISAETTLNTGADYAEYFTAEEEVKPGDLVGLNPITGNVRAYRENDHLLGVVSTSPGVIGNSELAKQSNTVLVGLVGQVPFNEKQVVIKNGKIWTHDHKPVGYLLANGYAYINFSSADHEQSQQIHRLIQRTINQNREITSLKRDSEEKNRKMEALKQRLEKIEKLLEK